MVETIKFSQMTNAGDINNNDIMPSLRTGENVILNNPWTFLPSGDTASRPSPSSIINYRLRFNTEDQLYEYYDAVLGAWTQLQETGFTVGPYITYTADTSLPDAQNLGLLANGILKQTITTGSATIDIAVNGTDFYGPGFVIPSADGGTGINNGSRTINLGSSTTGFVLTSDSSGNATWQTTNLAGAVLLDPSGNQIITAHDLQVSLGTIISGSTAGSVQGAFLGYSPTIAKGSLELICSDNSGNFANVITNVSTTAARTWALPDESGTFAMFGDIPVGPVLLNPAADQSIIAHNLFLTNGGFISGSITGPVSSASGTIQAVGINTQGSFYTASYINSGSASTFWCYKSRSTSVGSFVPVQAGDQIGRLEFFGDDGTQFTECSHIIVQATGTISSGIVPSVMTISTANSSGVLTQAIVIDENQKSTFSSLAFSPTTNGIVGTTTNDSASSGFVGEEKESIIPNASAISLTNNTNISVTSISLTAGDWDLYGNISLSGDASTLLQYYSCWVGVSSSTPDPSLWAGQSYGSTGLAVFAENQVGDTAPFTRISLSTTTTVHLAVIAGFSVSTCTACGGIFARRAR